MKSFMAALVGAAVVVSCASRSLNVSKEDTLNNIQREYELSKEDAEKYLETYWK